MYLVIDVGGTFTKYGYYLSDGKCLDKGKMDTVKSNCNDFYKSIINLISDDIEGIALSMPGIIDSDKGYIHTITLLPFLNRKFIKQELESLSHLPVTIENDAKCATLGEMWKGSLREVRNGFMIVLGTGIGGTCLLNGKIMSSVHHKAGEIGSVLIPEDNHYERMTNFGRMNNAVDLIHDLSEIMNCDNDGKIVFERLPDCQKAMEYLKRYASRIATMIYNLDYLFDLDCVSIGGAISQQPLFIKSIQQEFQSLRQVYKEDLHEPYIIACQLNNDAQLLGALYHHIKE